MVVEQVFHFNLNCATVVELDAEPKIGIDVAKRSVLVGLGTGQYLSWADLSSRVKGVGARRCRTCSSCSLSPPYLPQGCQCA